jgi:hypothetical protein
VLLDLIGAPPISALHRLLGSRRGRHVLGFGRRGFCVASALFRLLEDRRFDEAHCENAGQERMNEWRQQGHDPRKISDL